MKKTPKAETSRVTIKGSVRCTKCGSHEQTHIEHADGSKIVRCAVCGRVRR